MKSMLLASFALCFLILAFGVSAFAGEIHPRFVEYLDTLDDNDYASAIVYLRDRPNIRALDNDLHAAKAPMAVRHRDVLATLKDAAQRSQPDLLGYLDTRKAAGVVTGYTPYWIANMVVVYATKAELMQIVHRPEVEAIEANFRATLIAEAGNAYMGSPIAGIGATSSLRAINAHRVWYELGYTGLGTLIGGMDTGVDGSHPALTARWRGNTHPWYECWRDALGGGTTYPTDGHGHGTHTMGTMCGVGLATSDTIGVAFEAEWIADNSINQSVGPEFDNDVLGAFQWFADPDGDPGTTDDVPDVVQNSWGIDGRFGYDYQDCDYRWQEAIENCEAAGVVVTFSAGNEGPSAQTHRSPANIINSPTVNFAVGAVDCENYDWPYPIAYFSSRGPSDCDAATIKPEVCAPGVNVYSSYPGGYYTTMSGTSMAGPHVAGVVALMRQANPNADVQTIKQVLMDTARDLGTAGEDNTYGWGVIDAYAAVLAVSEPDTEPPVVAVTAPNGGETMGVGSAYTITWTATDNVGVTSIELYYSYDGGATYDPIATLSGNPGSYGWTVPDTPSTQCLVRADAFDAASNEDSDVSDNFFTIEGDTEPPVVTVTAPNGGETLTVGSGYTITWAATDNVGVTEIQLYYSYDGGVIYNLIDVLSSNPGSYGWTVPDTPSTQCLVRVDAFDAASNEDSDVSDNFFTIEAGAVNYVYVQSIDITLETKGKSTNAQATVVIRDQDDNPMFRAEVHSHWDGLTTDSDVFYTKKNGRGSCDSDKLKNPFGCWDYYVDDVVVPGYIFRSDIGETYGQVCTYIAPGPSAVLTQSFSVSHTCCDAVTEFSMSLPQNAHVTLAIYDIRGHRVKTVVDETLPAGLRTLIWDGTNDWGQPVSSGVYFYRAAADEEIVTQKMMVVR